ncbi:MAG TPA: OB-fold domain-containing protein [Stellaceae bacterium]|nr:OB-fold domain-containing protein [Stellaceae bacterium]
MTAKTRPIPAPRIDPELVAYWEAARQGRLLIKQCQACSEFHFYPRALCPFCFSDRTEWREASGSGTIYSFSVMRRVPIPYALAYVTLAEGPTVMTNIVGRDLDAIRIGQKVRVVFEASESGQPVPVFTPA